MSSTVNNPDPDQENELHAVQENIETGGFTIIHKALISLAVFALLIAGIFFYILYSSQTEWSGQPKTTEISRGMSTSAIAKKLKQDGILANETAFILLSRILGKSSNYKSGVYEFTSGESLVEIMDTLSLGRGKLVSITIPEGKNKFEIFEILSKKGFGSVEEFLEVEKSENILNKIQFFTEKQNIEGFLYPETYSFSPGLSPEAILTTMIRHFINHLPEELTSRAAELNMSPYELLILASIIEKETGFAEERKLIASVFHNRLRRGIPLQTDPTVIYGIKDFDGNIRRSDLKTKTPYNTYMFRGLPPTPISNPGESALKAAMYPEKSNYLYFVAKGDGTSKFSTNLRDHNNAVRQFQLRRRNDYRSY